MNTYSLLLAFACGSGRVYVGYRVKKYPSYRIKVSPRQISLKSFQNFCCESLSEEYDK